LDRSVEKLQIYAYISRVPLSCGHASSASVVRNR